MCSCASSCSRQTAGTDPWCYERSETPQEPLRNHIIKVKRNHIKSSIIFFFLDYLKVSINESNTPKFLLKSNFFSFLKKSHSECFVFTFLNTFGLLQDRLWILILKPLLPFCVCSCESASPNHINCTTMSSTVCFKHLNLQMTVSSQVHSQNVQDKSKNNLYPECEILLSDCKSCNAKILLYYTR